MASRALRSALDPLSVAALPDSLAMMPAAFPEVLLAIRGQALLRLRSLGGHGRKTWLSASGIFIPSFGFSGLAGSGLQGLYLQTLSLKTQNCAQPNQRVRDTSLRTPFVGVRQGAGSRRRNVDCAHPRQHPEPPLKH